MGLYSNSSLVFVFSFSKRLLPMSGGHYRGQRRLDDEVVMRPTHKRSRARTRQSQPAPASCGSDPEASRQSNFILLSGRRQNSFVCPLTLSRCQLELVFDNKQRACAHRCIHTGPWLGPECIRAVCSPYSARYGCRNSLVAA